MSFLRHRLAPIVCCACACVGGLGAQDRPAPDRLPKLRLRGRVLDENGAPIAGAGVVWGREDAVTTAQALDEPMARTGDDGRFDVVVVAGVDADVLLIAALRRVGFRDPRLPLRSWASGLHAVEDLGDVRLPPGVGCSGRVRDDDGKPIAGARVLALDLLWTGTGAHGREPRFGSQAFTDDQGRFVLPGVFAEGMLVTVTAPGCYDLALRGVHQGTPLDLVLQRSGFVDCTVRDVAGEPYSGAVGLQYEWPETAPHHESAVDGRVRLPVRYRCRFGVCAGDWTELAVLGPVLAGPSADVQIRFAPPPDESSMRVHAVDAVGKAVPRFRASAMWFGEVPDSAATMLLAMLRLRLQPSWPDGAARLDGQNEFGETSGIVLVQAHGYAPKLLTKVEWKAGSALRVELAKGSRLRGRVVDAATGAPIGGAVVRRATEAQPDPHAPPIPDFECVSAADGSFAFDDLPAATWHLTARHPNGTVETTRAVTIETDRGEADVELKLPAGRTIAGLVTGIAAARGCRIALERTPRPARSWWQQGEGVLAAWNEPGAVPLGADGSFRIDHCAKGEATLVLVVPSAPRQGACLRIPLRRIVITADLHLEIDARENRPGRLRGTLRTTGADVPRGRLAVVAVHVADLQGTTVEDAWREPLRHHRWSAVREDGTWSIDAVPGRYRLDVVDVATGIRLLAGQEVELAGGAAVTVQLEARVAAVIAQLRSSDGAPHYASAVAVDLPPFDSMIAEGHSFPGSRFGSPGLPLDGSEEEVRLLVPPGAVRVRVEAGANDFTPHGTTWRHETRVETTVEATAGEPVRAVLEVPPPPTFGAQK